MRIFNLSRALRPKQFSQVVGQDLVVKILCNSLALNKIFPTYIFSGQRGLGKTTCARIFASALLCQESQTILKNKSIEIPCGKCQDCKMFMAGRHPDFIEIDAASNPGVENVREILENALLTPVAGSYKIYLIDEVHMLSKAAFNAFLKMLEEPPATACFLMATTDIQKVPDTIRSRALQLLFWPAGWQQMINFLDQTVKANNLDVKQETLGIVTKLAEGSYRDALNRLEQVSLLENLTAEQQLLACKNMFGVSDNKSTIELIKLMLNHDSKAVALAMNEESFVQSDSAKLFQQILEILNIALEIQVASNLAEGQDEKLVAFACSTPEESLRTLASFFWSNEEFFYSSKNKDVLIKNLILKACQKNHGAPTSSEPSTKDPVAKAPSKTPPAKNNPTPAKKAVAPESEFSYQDELETEVEFEDPVSLTTSPRPNLQAKSKNLANGAASTMDPALEANNLWGAETTKQEVAAAWDLALQDSAVASDKLLVSILKQAKNIKTADGELSLSFAAGGDFFKSKIKACEKTILSAAQKAFVDKEFSRIEVVLSPTENTHSAHRPKAARSEDITKKTPTKNTNRNLEDKIAPPTSKNKPTAPDLDEKQWPKSSLMVNLFQGEVESE